MTVTKKQTPKTKSKSRNRVLKFYISVKHRFCRVADLDKRDDLMLITNSQDINAVKEHFGNPKGWSDYGCLFVEIVDGDYGDIFGCESDIPYMSYWVDKIERGYK
jgi:hypothetical protein